MVLVLPQPVVYRQPCSAHPPAQPALPFALQAVQSHSPGSAAKSGTAGKWRFVLGGGQPPCTGLGVPGACDLYFTGHRDGRVRAWDMTSNVPALVATVPHDSGGPGGKLRGVASLQASQLGTHWSRDMGQGQGCTWGVLDLGAPGNCTARCLPSAARHAPQHRPARRWAAVQWCT